MTESRFVAGAILAALAIAAVGCADRPSPQVAGGPSPTLLEEAHRLGYSPKVIDGQTVFCQHQELTGSMVPTEHCIGQAALESDITAQRESLHELQNSLGQGSKAMGPSK